MGLSDYIVPPNPQGGSGDYYPIIAAPGERVNVTPAGQSSGISGANISVTLNIGGSSSSAQEIQAAVYDAINDVIRTAAEAAR
jgi:ABC-type phosphate transport system substrate-binding protein